MQLTSSTILKSIFALKGNFSAGILPLPKAPLPGVEIAPFKNNAKAAVCISGDFELSWAFRSSGPEVARSKATTERRNIPLILDLLETHSVPVTWATVGHLFLESCRRSTTGVAHPDMPRPSNHRWSGDWYVHDPCTDVRKDPLWYSPDLIEKILGCKTRHEIGTHSFSHIDFSKNCSTPELVKREFVACVEAMAAFGLRPRSFVFPHNHIEYDHEQAIASAGITSVRHRDKNIRLSYPERTSTGMYKLYESMNLRAARHYDYVEKAKIFIQKAIERRSAYSIWFHPSDPLEIFQNQFEGILKHIDERRHRGDLWVTTMGELAAYCEARECLQIEMQRGQDSFSLLTKSSLDTVRYGMPEATVNVSMPAVPKSIWQEFSNGERVPLELSKLFIGTQKGSQKDIALNVSPDVRIVHFAF